MVEFLLNTKLSWPIIGVTVSVPGAVSYFEAIQLAGIYELFVWSKWIEWDGHVVYCSGLPKLDFILHLIEEY
jgi:hypothetical protein